MFDFFLGKKLGDVLQAVYDQQSLADFRTRVGALSLSLHKLPVHLNSPPGTVTILLHVVLLSDTPHPLPQETSRLQTRIIIPSRLLAATGVGLLRIFCILRNPCPRLRKLSDPILHNVFYHARLSKFFFIKLPYEKYSNESC